MPDSLTHNTSQPSTAPVQPVSSVAAPSAVAPQAAAPATVQTADTAALASDSLALVRPAEPEPEPVAVLAKPKPWESGMVPVNRPETAATNSGMAAIIMAMLLLTVLCMRQSGRLLKAMYDDITRNRHNRHDLDERTPAQSRLIAIFATQACVYGGILLLAYVRTSGTA